jgi:hypothetical protein
MGRPDSEISRAVARMSHWRIWHPETNEHRHEQSPAAVRMPTQPSQSPQVSDTEAADEISLLGALQRGSTRHGARALTEWQAGRFRPSPRRGVRDWPGRRDMPVFTMGDEPGHGQATSPAHQGWEPQCRMKNRDTRRDKPAIKQGLCLRILSTSLLVLSTRQQPAIYHCECLKRTLESSSPPLEGTSQRVQ